MNFALLPIIEGIGGVLQHLINENRNNNEDFRGRRHRMFQHEMIRMKKMRDQARKHNKALQQLVQANKN